MVTSRPSDSAGPETSRAEPTASRLVSIHNVAWTLDLTSRMRAAIEAGTFAELRRRILSVWADGG